MYACMYVRVLTVFSAFGVKTMINTRMKLMMFLMDDKLGNMLTDNYAVIRLLVAFL